MALPGNPRGGSIRCSCSGDDGGRWCDAGTPEANQKAGVPGSFAWMIVSLENEKTRKKIKEKAK